MAATVTIRHRQTTDQNHPKIAKPSAAAIDHAVRLIHAICGLAASPTWIDDIRADLRADKVQAAVRNRDTAVVFDWLMAALSYQGIADQVAYDRRRTAYLARSGLRVLRFWNSDVLTNSDGVCLTILDACGGEQPGGPGSDA